jgi:hypothetical protein
VSQSLNTAHINVVCSDDVLRRFYLNTDSAYGLQVTGHVIYDSLHVYGTVVRKGAIQHFIPTTPSPIPTKSGWHIPVHCNSLKHCVRCRRCVGGCRK